MSLSALIERHLACPVTRQPVQVNGDRIAAPGSSFQGRVQDDVAVMLEQVPVSFFDDKFAVMQRGHDERGGEWQVAYGQQVALLERHLAAGGLTLDVGCGPALPYRKSAATFVVGLEYSLPSVAANRQVDLRVCASAAALPLRDASVDTIVCFYSIHHMIGGSVAETETLIGSILREFKRVIRPGGTVLIFEMAPVRPFGWFERIGWPLGKRLLGAKLDMFFWPVHHFSRLAGEIAPAGSLEVVTFVHSPWVTFPPVFSLPWFRLPRFLYPFKPVLYRWRPQPAQPQ